MRWLHVSFTIIATGILLLVMAFVLRERNTVSSPTAARSSSQSEVVITVVLVEATATTTPTPKPTMTPFPQPTPWPTWGGQEDGKLYLIPTITATPIPPLVHPLCVAVTPERGSVVICHAWPFRLPEVF